MEIEVATHGHFENGNVGVDKTKEGGKGTVRAICVPHCFSPPLREKKRIRKKN
jgi:hypothetical protein